jgi:Flp pilus assembly protein TadD
MRCPHDRRFLAGALLAGALTALTGCAQTGPVAPATAAQPTTLSDKDRARLEVDGTSGFTVTEIVHIDGDVRADYQSAIVLLQQNQLDAGIAQLESVVARAPELTTPHIDLGIAYGHKGANDKAEQSLQAALALTPNHPVALNELGMLYRRTGKFAEARASYERALSVDPNYHYALRNLGVLCDLYLADLQCALHNYQSYDELVGNDAQVKIWIADIQSRLNTGQ